MLRKIWVLPWTVHSSRWLNTARLTGISHWKETFGWAALISKLKKESRHKSWSFISKATRKTFTLKSKSKSLTLTEFILKLLRPLHLRNKVVASQLQQESLFKWTKKLAKLSGKCNEIIHSSIKRIQSSSKSSQPLKNRKTKIQSTRAWSLRLQAKRADIRAKAKSLIKQKGRRKKKRRRKKTKRKSMKRMSLNKNQRSAQSSRQAKKWLFYHSQSMEVIKYWRSAICLNQQQAYLQIWCHLKAILHQFIRLPKACQFQTHQARRLTYPKFWVRLQSMRKNLQETSHHKLLKLMNHPKWKKVPESKKRKKRKRNRRNKKRIRNKKRTRKRPNRLKDPQVSKEKLK